MLYEEIFLETSRPLGVLPLSTILNGKYLIGRVLGVGGFGVTYLAWGDHLAVPVAIKEYMPDRTFRDTNRVTLSSQLPSEFIHGKDLFSQEAQILARLDHTNIVRVLDYFEENGTAYFVMPYYNGKSLTKYVADKGGRIPEAEAVNIMIPILDGLREVHTRIFVDNNGNNKSLLHRDVKPDNIYLGVFEKGKVRPILLDFGAARLAIGELSKSLSIVLTPGYAPIEQYQSKGQGPFTDVYGCAATLYTIVTGHRPPPATDRIHQDTLIHPSLFGISNSVAKALIGGLAVSSTERIQTVDIFLSMLMEKNIPATPLAQSPAAPVGYIPATPLAQSPAAPVGYIPMLQGQVKFPRNNHANILLIIISIATLLFVYFNFFSDTKIFSSEKGELLTEMEPNSSELFLRLPPPTTNGFFPLTKSQLISVSDIQDKNAFELEIMRNEIYARSGYIFNSKHLRELFSKQSWYLPKYPSEKQNYVFNNIMSEVDRQNVRTINQVECEKRYKSCNPSTNKVVVTPQFQTAIVTTPDFLALKVNPSINAHRITKIYPSERIQVNGKTNVCETIARKYHCWYQVDYNGSIGYVFGAYLIFD